MSWKNCWRCLLRPVGSHFEFLAWAACLHLKGWDFALQAFARFHSLYPDSEYWIAGDGPERKRLSRMTQELGLHGKVTFWGTVPRDRVFEMLGQSDVLLFPCLHDSGGWASVEAMAAGRPVICLDLGGPALQVTEATGIKIPAIAPEQVVTDLTMALSELSIDTPRRMKLGEQGRERVRREFNWEKKGEDLARIYSQITGERNFVPAGISLGNRHA